MSYRKLEIWQLAKQQAKDIYEMTKALPSSETFVISQQIRRSAVSVMANIAEGYGRKKYQAEYAKFIVYALGSNNETISHLEVIFETVLSHEQALYERLHKNAVRLGVKINNFHQTLQAGLRGNIIDRYSLPPDINPS